MKFSLPFLILRAAAIKVAAEMTTRGYGSPDEVEIGGDSFWFNFTIVNKHPEPITAWNVNGAGSSIPKLVAGRDDSIISSNEMTTYNVSGKWSGGFQVNTAANGITGKDSLIEGSMALPQGLFLDVSNVYVYARFFELSIAC